MRWRLYSRRLHSLAGPSLCKIALKFQIVEPVVNLTTAKVKYAGPVASGQSQTSQDVSADGSFPRKQPRLPLRYSLNR
jgi:hypothetical protein